MVGSSSTRQLTPSAIEQGEQRRGCARPATGRAPARLDVVGAEAELGQQRPGLAERHAGARLEARRAASAAGERPGPGRARPTTTPGPNQRAPGDERELPSSAPSSVDLPRRSARGCHAVLPADLQVDGTEPEARRRSTTAPLEPGHDVAAARRRRQLELEAPALPRLVDRRRAGSSWRSVALTFAGLLLAAGDLALPDVLVGLAATS